MKHLKESSKSLKKKKSLKNVNVAQMEKVGQNAQPAVVRDSRMRLRDYLTKNEVHFVSRVRLENGKMRALYKGIRGQELELVIDELLRICKSGC